MKKIGTTKKSATRYFYEFILTKNLKKKVKIFFWELGCLAGGVYLAAIAYDCSKLAVYYHSCDKFPTSVFIYFSVYFFISIPAYRWYINRYHR